MTERNLAIRLSVMEGGKVKAELKEIGESGEKSLKKIELAGQPASKSLLALNAAANDVRGSAIGLTSQIGPLGSAMAALGPAGIAAGAGLGAMVIMLKKSFDEAALAEQAQNRLMGVLRATGYASGLTGIHAISDLSVDNLDIESALDSEALAAPDLRAGIWDNAEVLIFLVNWAALSQGKIILKRGTIGQVELKDTIFKAELRGLTQALSQQIGELYTPDCRADLGDTRCKIDLAALTVASAVTAATDRYGFIDTARTEADDYWSGGLITWTSGANMLPNSRRMREGLTTWLVSIPVSEALQADILFMAWGREPQHVALITDKGIIHSYSGVGKVVEHALDEDWKRRIVAAYRYPYFIENP